jgi:ABC-type polysaccharide/polyol phosphate export permease
LGILWTLLDPLLNMIVLTVIFSTLFGREIANFPVYLMSGRMIFTFFSQGTGFCLTSISGGGLYIKSVKMPLFMLPLSKVLSALINDILSLIALFAIMLLTGADFYWTIVLFPLPVLYTMLFSLGVGMMLAAWVVFFNDVSYLYSILITLLMFCTPIFYQDTIYPENVAWLFKSSPIYRFVQMFRDVIMNGAVPELSAHLICLAWCAGALVIGGLVFRKSKEKFILYL